MRMVPAVAYPRTSLTGQASLQGAGRRKRMLRLVSHISLLKAKCRKQHFKNLILDVSLRAMVNGFHRFPGFIMGELVDRSGRIKFMVIQSLVGEGRFEAFQTSIKAGDVLHVTATRIFRTSNREYVLWVVNWEPQTTAR